MKLIILDLDETLIHTSPVKLKRRNLDFMFEDHFVYKRNYLKDFLVYCFSVADVAVWTSATDDYARFILTKLEIHHKLKFIHCRDKCTVRYNRETMEFSYIKNLKKVKNLGYTLEETVVIDDSPEKHIRNYGNLITVKPFFGQEDGELLSLIKYLQWLHLQDNVRLIDKRNWNNLV